jgi:hypothetical protein
VPRGALPKLVKYAVAMRLLHLGMDVKARVSNLSDFLGKKLNSVYRVAEDDGLVDFQLARQARIR